MRWPNAGCRAWRWSRSRPRPDLRQAIRAGADPAFRRQAGVERGDQFRAAARMAAERGVRVYTVGIGTPNGEIIAGEGWRMRVRLDEDALKGIAKETRGEYFYAGTAADLKKVYSNLNSKLVMERKETEVTALFTAAAAALAMLSGLLSLLWFNRVL